MNSNQLFKKYNSKLVLEGVLKSLIVSLIPAFALSFIAALITYIIGYNGLWLSVGICLATVAIVSPLFFFFKYRPSTKKAAERLDRLGLEERLVTMMELEKEQSYIAVRQREDAKEKLSSKNPQLKFSIKRNSVVMLAVVAVLSVSMTLLSVLGAKGIVWHPVQKFNVNYATSEGGYILGTAQQVVENGKDAALVVAVAEDGYAFEKWSDNLLDSERTDKNILNEITITAMFVRIGESNGDKASDEFAVDEPGLPGKGGEGPPTPGTGGSGKYYEYNYFLDGETYYRDYYEEYYNLAMQMLAESGEIPPELRAFIAAYFDIIV